MKFERQRNHRPSPDKYDLNNQQFLTFRNNPNIENTGRSVYSQQFDYKSLEKYQKIDEDQQTPPNFRKNIKDAKSQDKYKQITAQATLAQLMDENTTNKNGIKEKDEDLKAKLNSLIKMLKKEQQRQHQLNEEIEKYKHKIEENNQNINESQRNIEELSEISDQNLQNYNQMLAKFKHLELRVQEYQKQLDSIQNSIDNGSTQIMTARSKDMASTDYYKKIQTGIKSLSVLSTNLNDKISVYSEQIHQMKDYLQELQYIDQQIKQIGRL